MDPQEFATAQKSLLAAQKTDNTLKSMKRSINRDKAIVSNKETIAGLQILTYENPTIPDPGPGDTSGTPVAPSTYTVPAGATPVSTSAALISALASSPAKDIVLENGTYDTSPYFTNSIGHNLYARTLLGATLTAGIQGGASGQYYQGLKFDVTTDTKTFNTGGSSILNIWGGTGLTVLDCWMDGHYALHWGLRAGAPGGLIFQRCWLTRFKWGGAYINDNQGAKAYHTAGIPIATTITDIDGTGFTMSPPGASNSYEALILIAHPVTNTVTRIRSRACGRKAMELFGNAWDTTYSYLDLDPRGAGSTMGIGVYMEHKAYYCTIENFTIKGAERGFNCEWDGSTTGPTANAAAHHITIRNGIIDADGAHLYTANGKSYGIYRDQGTEDVQITNTVFKGQNWAGIGYNQPYPVGAPVTFDSTNTNQMLGAPNGPGGTGAVTLRAGSWGS